MRKGTKKSCASPGAAVQVCATFRPHPAADGHST